MLILVTQNLNAQKNGSPINSDNYYNYLHSNTKDLIGKNLITSWLTSEEATPVIMEEFKIAGYEYIYDHCLYRLANGLHIVLTAYSRKAKVGFLYIDGHYMDPSPSDRLHPNRYKQLLGIDYSQTEETESGVTNFLKIRKLPRNIFILAETVYWYQNTESAQDSEKLVSKENAINILRQDIRNYFKKS